MHNFTPHVIYETNVLSRWIYCQTKQQLFQHYFAEMHAYINATSNVVWFNIYYKMKHFKIVAWKCWRFIINKRRISDKYKIIIIFFLSFWTPCIDIIFTYSSRYGLAHSQRHRVRFPRDFALILMQIGVSHGDTRAHWNNINLLWHRSEYNCPFRLSVVTKSEQSCPRFDLPYKSSSPLMNTFHYITFHCTLSLSCRASFLKILFFK